MNLVPPKSTSRKFYNKWLYKITLHLQGAAILRYDLYKVIDFYNDAHKEGIWGWQNKALAEKDFVLELVNFLSSKDKNIWSKRVERSFIDFYTNDQKFFDELSILASDRIIHRYQPTDQGTAILENSATNVAVPKFPHDRYKHKVYLLPHKMKGDKESKEKYVDWLKKQYPKVTCTPAIANWFVATDWNWDRRYILVEDESMLLMLKLRNSEVVGRVYNYVLCDK